jgi:membrane protein YdbS with pleckstrin-like domain
MKRGLVFKTERTIPLSKVQDVQITQGPLGAYIQMSSAGGAYGVMVFGQLPKTAAAEFVAALELARKGI